MHVFFGFRKPWMLTSKETYNEGWLMLNRPATAGAQPDQSFGSTATECGWAKHSWSQTSSSVQHKFHHLLPLFDVTHISSPVPRHPGRQHWCSTADSALSGYCTSFSSLFSWGTVQREAGHELALVYIAVPYPWILQQQTEKIQQKGDKKHRH